MKLHLLLTILACLSQAAIWTEATKKRVCYFTNWAQYRPNPMKFWPEDVDPHLCTHIVYAFSDMHGNHLHPYEWNDPQLFARLMQKKIYNPELKILLAVGGWTFDLTKMTAMLSTEANRAEFISSSIGYLRQYGFDGLDLDFEYPGARGSIPEDIERYTFLVQEARVAFNAESANTGNEALLLTAAVACGAEYIEGYEIHKISLELDWIAPMAYDFNGGFDSITGLNAPLHANAPDASDYYEKRSLDWCANRWLEGGAPKNKLVLGLPAHGRGFTLEDSNNNGLYAPAKLWSNPPPPLTEFWGSLPAPYTREAGVFSYYEICQLFLNHNTPVERPDIYDVPYTYLDDQWASFEDLQSITLKAQYICENDFSGYMAWSLDLDDFKGLRCGNGINPLLTKMKEIIESDSCTSPPPTTTTTVPTPSTTPPTPPTTTTVTTTSVSTPSTSSTPPPPTITATTTTTPTPAQTTTTVPTTTYSTIPGSECVPNFCDKKPDGAYTHENCKKFIICYVDCVVLECDALRYWNPDRAVCDPRENLSEERLEECDLAKVLTEQSQGLCQGKPPGRYAVPGTCTSYVDCLSGQPRDVVHHCTRGRCYDPQKKRCSLCSHVKCQ